MRRRWVPWIVIGLLAGLCCVLAILQYTWLTQFASAQRDQLRQDLQNHLSLLARSFNDEISNATAALTATASEIDEIGRDRAYAARYASWRGPMFRRIALAIPDGGDTMLRMLDLNTVQFSPVEWPQEWSRLREQLRSRLSGRPVPPGDSRTPSLLEIPRFGPGGEQEWLVLELNVDYLRATVLPELLRRYAGDSYDAEAVLGSNPDVVIFSTGTARIAGHEDASITLLEDQMRRGGPGRDGRGPGRFGTPPGGSPGGPRPPMQGRWRLYVRHRTGSLEAVVARTRSRNLAVAGALLLLIVAAVAVLIRVSRQAQRLAELQMNFVAGVSHELRTPLSVIRTAAYNLRGKLSHRPEQVERYGELIQEESEKLARMVEQILRFASNQAGHVVRELQPASAESIVASALDSTRSQIQRAAIDVETKIEPGVPMILADVSALQHAVQNLIENALKYAADARWIGIHVASADCAVQIQVADRGPGIPPDEIGHVFDPFYRGRSAIADQIHGTGLGLSLVKKIVEAHGGTISVRSEPGEGTEFTLRIPAQESHELAHSID